MNINHIKDQLTLFKEIVKGRIQIPVLDVQKQLDDDCRDKIEFFSCKIADLEDTNRVLNDINDRLRQREKESQDRITSYQAAVNERSFAVARLTSLESDVRRLTESLKVETGNRDHFRALVVQQDAFIKEAKRQILEFKSDALGFKSDLESKLKTKTSEVVHLAKQALRLNEENSQYRTDNVELLSKNNQLNTQTPLLMEENRKFREQTARLIEEKRKLQEQVNQFECEGCRTGEMGAYCGGCVGCLMRQAEHNMNENDKALRVECNVSSYKDSIIETLTKTLDVLKAMPCITWRQQGVAYRNCKSTVAALNRNIDNIREHHIVPKKSV